MRSILASALPGLYAGLTPVERAAFIARSAWDWAPWSLTVGWFPPRGSEVAASLFGRLSRSFDIACFARTGGGGGVEVDCLVLRQS